MTRQAGNVPCSRCKGDAKFAGYISPLSPEPGWRIYRCEACETLVWVASPRDAVKPAASAHQRVPA